MDLLEQFLAEEAVPYVRSLIKDAVSHHHDAPNEVEKHFEFNRFELTLDFANKTVLIEDVLEAGAKGEARIGLPEFLLRLNKE